MIGSLSGVPTCAVRLVGPRVQQPGVDVHRYPLLSRCNTTTTDLLINSSCSAGPGARLSTLIRVHAFRRDQHCQRACRAPSAIVVRFRTNRPRNRGAGATTGWTPLTP